LAEAVLGGGSMAGMKVATEGRCCCWGGAEEDGLVVPVAQHGVVFS